MKKALLLVCICLGVALSVGAQPAPTEPILSKTVNSNEAQNRMLANTYQLSFLVKKLADGRSEAGFATAFRIHKNWFLTTAHGPLQTKNPQNKAVLPVKITVDERPDAPGASAPFSIVIDLTEKKLLNGKVFLFNPSLKLTSSNEGRGDDLALIYVPDADPFAPVHTEARGQIQQFTQQIPYLQEVLPAKFLTQAQDTMSAGLSTVSSLWGRFLSQRIYPFQLLILSEKNIEMELASFPLTAYYIQDPKKGVVRFTFIPQGTHRGTNAIFYRRVTNLIPGTSGSPMTYGSYVVSFDSATNCSPMLTQKVCRWIQSVMGADFDPDMCVYAPEPSEKAILSPVHREVTDNWRKG